MEEFKQITITTKLFFEDEVDPDAKTGILNATIGYRTNLPEEKETDKTGFEKSRKCFSNVC